MVLHFRWGINKEFYFRNLEFAVNYSIVLRQVVNFFYLVIDDHYVGHSYCHDDDTSNTASCFAFVTRMLDIDIIYQNHAHHTAEVNTHNQVNFAMYFEILQDYFTIYYNYKNLICFENVALVNDIWHSTLMAFYFSYNYHHANVIL